MNILVAFVILFFLASRSQMRRSEARDRIEQPARPRRRVLKPGDQIISVDGVAPP